MVLTDKRLELSDMQRRYVDELMSDPDRNQTNAALRAGYSPKTAKTQASMLMDNPKVVAAISAKEDELSKVTGITPARIMRELEKIGFANLQDFATLTEDGGSIRDLPRDIVAAISEYNVESTEGRGIKTSKAKIRLSDKRTALIDMGKQIGMWKQQVEHSGSINFAQLVEDSISDTEVIEGEIVSPEQLEDLSDQ